MSRLTIWKFRISVIDAERIEVPAYARFITARIAGGPPPANDPNNTDRMDGYGEFIELWAEVDPTAPTRPIKVAVVGTGHPLWPVEEGMTYLSTVFDDELGLVWHVYIQEGFRA